MNVPALSSAPGSRFGTLMRALIIAATATLAAAAASAQTSATWSAVGPPGGTITAVRANPAVAGAVYAGTAENGIFYSADGGRTWGAASGGLAPSNDTGRQQLYAVFALVSDGQYMYAATGSGLYYTAAAGSPQWLPLAGPTNAPRLTMLAYDAATQRLFAASDATDGVTAPRIYSKTLAPPAAPTVPAWVSSALPDTAIGAVVNGLAVVTQPGSAASGGLLVAVGNTVQAATLLTAAPDLVWSNADPAGALAAGSVNAVAWSADFSQAYACSGSIPFSSGNPLDAQPLWLPLTVVGAGADPFNCTGFVSIPIAAGGAPNLLLGTDQGAFTSSDGQRFDALARMSVSPAANDFAVVASTGATTELLVAGGFGVGAIPVSSLAPAAAWSARSGPASVAAGGANARLNNTSTWDTAVLGSTLYAAVSTNHYRDVLASADGGATWTSTGIAAVLGPLETPTQLLADAVNGVLYVASSQGLLAYTPSGGRWATVGAAAIGTVSAMSLGSTHVFVGTDTGLFAIARGTSPGSAVPVAAGLTTLSVKALLVAGANVYVGALDQNSGEHAVSTASEASAAAGTAVWSAFGTSPVGSRVTSLLLIDNTLLAATNGGLLRYATAGAPWASANVSADPAAQVSDAFNVVNSLYTDGVTIFAATGNNGVFIAPYGTSFLWTPFSGSGDTALPSLEVRSLRGSGTTLYAATRAGVATITALSGTPTPPPGPTPDPGGSSSGGGAFSPVFAALLLLAVGLLRRRRPD